MSPDATSAFATPAAGSANSGFARYLSANPGKRAAERYWLLYTPVWGGVTAVLMIGGFVERWGDLACMAYGVALAAFAIAGPLLMRVPEEAGEPLHRRAGFKMALSVTGLAFALNYSQTPFFWDVLHMHYGFGTTINIQNNPVFLYFVSVAYFATYSVLCCMIFRALRARCARVLRAAAYVVAPMAMAFLETALNANPFTQHLFCYDDKTFALWFGTLAYGMAFVYALPMWMAIDENPRRRVRAAAVVVLLFAAVYADVLTLDLLRYHVAPRFTQVVPGANGLRDVGTSCLGRTRKRISGVEHKAWKGRSAYGERSTYGARARRMPMKKQNKQNKQLKTIDAAQLKNIRGGGSTQPVPWDPMDRSIPVGPN
jgi:cycloeucalenol cycloisomerase